MKQGLPTGKEAGPENLTLAEIEFSPPSLANSDLTPMPVDCQPRYFPLQAALAHRVRLMRQILPKYHLTVASAVPPALTFRT